MPNTIEVRHESAEEIDANEVEVGVAYVVTRCENVGWESGTVLIAGRSQWESGTVLIAGRSQLVCPQTETCLELPLEDDEVLFVRRLRPGESVTIRGGE